MADALQDYQTLLEFLLSRAAAQKLQRTRDGRVFKPGEMSPKYEFLSDLNLWICNQMMLERQASRTELYDMFTNKPATPAYLNAFLKIAPDPRFPFIDPDSSSGQVDVIMAEN